MEALPQDLADFLVTKNFDPEYFDDKGQPAEAGDAKTMKFDYVAGTGKNYGTAVIVVADNELSLFYGDNLGRGMDPDDKQEWFEFLEQLSNKAASHSATWSPKDINQLKHTLAGIAAIKEGLFEGYYGNRRVSYMGEQTQARLVINHNRVLGEEDKRFRYVESLFIETADQERFRLGFKSLAGGRAMLEHVRQGGRPYDVRGNHITEIVSEMAVLSRFNRAQHRRVYEGVTQELVESARQYYQNLQETMKHLSSSRGYQAYFESWAPDQVGEAEALVENLRDLFVEQTLDARIEAALPTLAKIQQQGNNMKEAQIFENWINNLSEGTWALPETPEQQEKLNQLMGAELIVGPDATNATELLYDIVGDDELFDILNDLADKSQGRANIWDDSDVQRRLAELGVQTPQSTQAEPADVPQDTAPAVKEENDQKMDSYKQQVAYNEKMAGENPPTDLGLRAVGEWAKVGAYGNPVKSAWLNIAKYGVRNNRFNNSVDKVMSAIGDFPDLEDEVYDMYDINQDEVDALYNAYETVHDQWEQTQGMAEGDNMSTFVEDRELAEMLKYAGVPVKESVLTDSTGSTLDHIQNTFKRDVKDFTQSGDMSDALYDALYDYYFDDMPYGTKKARDGDPHEWVSDRFAQDIGLDEGWKGALAGGLAGAGLGSVVPALGTVAGGIAGAYAGHKLGDQGFSDPDKQYKSPEPKKPVSEGSCNMTMEGSYCPEHGLAECGGMYEDGGAVGMPYSMGEDNKIVQNAKKLTDGWKGQLAGGTAGTLAGGALGAAGGPIGAAVGGALGGTAGQMIGDKLGGSEATDEGSTANVIQGAAKAATQGLGDVVGGGGKDILKNLLASESDDPINSNSAMTGSYYEGKETRTQEGDALLARIKSLALLR